MEECWGRAGSRKQRNDGRGMVGGNGGMMEEGWVSRKWRNEGEGI
jgi:hypothetical protein